jgi:hypothetical protein
VAAFCRREFGLLFGFAEGILRGRLTFIAENMGICQARILLNVSDSSILYVDNRCEDRERTTLMIDSLHYAIQACTSCRENELEDELLEEPKPEVLKRKSDIDINDHG